MGGLTIGPTPLNRFGRERSADANFFELAGTSPLPEVEERPETVDRPDSSDGETQGSGSWIVTVFDNDVNTQEEVVEVLIAATHCPVEEAMMETWEIHNLGKSVVHHSGKSECEEVAEIIRTIGIRVSVTQE